MLKRIRSVLTSAVALGALVACCCPARFEVNKDIHPGVDAAQPPAARLVPAEQPAADLVKKFGGEVTPEGGHVAYIAVFNNTFTDDDIKQFAPCTKLRELKLASTKITGSGFKDVANLPELTKLTVGQGPFTDAGLKEVARFTQLKYIWCCHCKVTDEGLKAIVPLTQLEELWVEGTGITDLGVEIVAKHFKQLHTLDVGNNQKVTDFGLMSLAVMPNLKRLTLYGTKTTDVGFAVFPKIATLEELSMNHPRVTDRTAQTLAECKNLHVLHLSATAMTDAGLQQLANLPLRELDLASNDKISHAAIQLFIKAHPNCKVQTR
jgi:internalin A